MNYSEIRMEARLFLKDHWNKLAMIWLVFLLIGNGLYYGASMILVGLNYVVGLLISGPLILSIAMIFLSVYEERGFEFEDLLKGFNSYSRAFMAYLLYVVYISLWSLLLIVPGIIAAIKYSQVFFIMAEDPHISAADALKLSMEMMKGHKSDLFLLGLSFIGWALLCILTLGIGFLWLGPYQQMTYTIFYKRVKKEYQRRIAAE